MSRRSAALLACVVVAGAATLFVGPAESAGYISEVGSSRQLFPRDCSPGDGFTWLLGSTGRIFEIPGTPRRRTPNGSLLPPYPAKIDGCLFSVGHPWRLNSRQVPWAPEMFSGIGPLQRPVIDPTTVVLNSPWVAYLETFIFVDTGTTFVAERNLRSGETSRCFASGIAAVNYRSKVNKIIVDGAGHLAWSREGRAGAVVDREVASCSLNGVKTVLDTSPNINWNSLEMHDSTLVWTDSGTNRSYNFAQH